MIYINFYIGNKVFKEREKYKKIVLPHSNTFNLVNLHKLKVLDWGI